MCKDCYENNKYEQEAYLSENTALTQSELEVLNLPPTFPKTDKALQKQIKQTGGVKREFSNK
jgi:hypothetical protein